MDFANIAIIEAAVLLLDGMHFAYISYILIILEQGCLSCMDRRRRQ